MSKKPTTPFSKSELLPQEEMLEIAKRKGKLLIGIPKETHFQEKRVCLTPDAIASLTAQGHPITFPLSSKYMSLFAKSGAFSR